jgi:hypothetical protein
MTDIDAIRARHVPMTVNDIAKDGMHVSTEMCSRDGIWPCDTATVLAALDCEREVSRSLGGAAVQNAQDLAAAEAREARLREALTAVLQDIPPSKCNGDCHGWASPGPCGACAEPSDHVRLLLASPEAET